MNTTVGTPAAEGGRIRSLGGALITVKKRWMAHLHRRIERAVIVQLQAMSDRELQDIGLTRAELECGGERRTRSPAVYPSPLKLTVTNGARTES